MRKDLLQSKIELWEAIHEYVVACGGDPTKHIYGNTNAMDAVIKIENICFNQDDDDMGDLSYDVRKQLGRSGF